MATAEIIEAKSNDLEAVAQLFDAYRVFYRQSSDVAAARTFIRERFARRDSVIFLARVSGEPAGFVQLYPSLSSVSMRPIWILNDLFVAPTARGAGVGRRLMDRAREFASASGALRIELTTERTNTTAQRLYHACGYARDEVFYKYILTVDARA
ncbi:MAG TPA: GNAT family N-acetyltransferase [Alphaproteobacteria bacterium]|nr:GNAT family N-acetyltransferase [Alphaproteobacteria bacterium]